MLFEIAATFEAEEEDKADALETVEGLANEDPVNVQTRMSKIYEAWARIKVAARDKAKPLGGKDTRAVMPNLTLLSQRYSDKVAYEDLVGRGQELQNQIKSFERNPDLLTPKAYKGFAISAGHFYRKIDALS